MWTLILLCTSGYIFSECVILGVQKTSQQEIKKAYHKLALRLHPNKNPVYENAKEKFNNCRKLYQNAW
ncbi:hypothetical protein L1987_08717 [Smallanthus sonchifolius]|uniref:Uncharacterized protein n=1 Tax=Smallanthus sonchifolius TaxID=185202 RepID=A0ACB9JLI4_9ASTR|nr:hypothetical protein L1987_08717 [Smallanthus sonchifolius]